MIKSRLFEMKMEQHPIPRDTFIKMFYYIWDKYSEYFYSTELENFKLWYNFDNETFYILHYPTGCLISFYKHLGRCLEVNFKLSIEDYQYLANELEIELSDI